METINRLAADAPDAAKQIPPSGDMPEDFEEGQWWLKELDAMVVNGTHDQKRAVAVVRKLMTKAKAQQPQAEPFGYVSQHTNGSWEFSPTAAGVYPDTAKSITAVYAKQPQAEDTIKRQAQKIAELTADRDGWIEAHARLHREYHDFRKAAPQQAEAVHSYVLELPDGDARQAKVCWSDRNEANGEIRHHLCISVAAAPQQAEAALQWCQDCGEGYVNFCRVKSADCKMKPKADKCQS